MIKALLSLIFSFFFWLAGIIGSILFYPLQLIIVTVFPTFGAYATSVVNFIVSEIYPLVTWIKHCLVNISGIPEEFWLLIVATWGFYLSAGASVRVYMLISNIYAYVRGTVVRRG